MSMTLIQFLAIVATALYLVPTGAHLFELPHKMALSPPEYMTVQQIYAGWELFGIVIGVALVATLANTIWVRADRRAFAWSLGAVLALAASRSCFCFRVLRKCRRSKKTGGHEATRRQHPDFSHPILPWSVLNAIEFFAPRPVYRFGARCRL